MKQYRAEKSTSDFWEIWVYIEGFRKYMASTIWHPKHHSESCCQELEERAKRWAKELNDLEQKKELDAPVA